MEQWTLRGLQIVESIFVQLLRQVQESGEKRFDHLYLVLGELSELGPASIQRHWKTHSKGTLAEQTQVHIRLISAQEQCMACFQKYQPTFGNKFFCPYCLFQEFRHKILSGEECHLESIQTESE